MPAASCKALTSGSTTPAPLEASGTSGQKASLNGAPNFSALDGWWPEAYNGRNGWTIGHEREYASLEEQDTEDAESLYTTLESSIVPLYYDRSASASRKDGSR